MISILLYCASICIPMIVFVPRSNVMALFDQTQAS